MPRLLQINATLNCGSTGRIAAQIALKASQYGWDCYYAHGGRYIGNSQFEDINVSSKFDNYFPAFIGEYSRGLYDSEFQTTRVIDRFIKQFDCFKK